MSILSTHSEEEHHNMNGTSSRINVKPPSYDCAKSTCQTRFYYLKQLLQEPTSHWHSFETSFELSLAEHNTERCRRNVICQGRSILSS